MANYSDYKINSGLRPVNASSGYTAKPSDLVITDSSAGAFTVTLPASPSNGAMVSILDTGSAGTNNVTVGRNGNTIDGLSEDFVVDIDFGRVDFVFSTSSNTWGFSLVVPKVSSGGEGLDPTFTATNYSANSGEFVLVDTSGGVVTITLPASPADGNRIRIADSGGNAAIDNITVDRNGETINGLSEDFVLDQNFGAVDLVYDGGSSDWKHQLIGYPDLTNVDDFIIGARRITLRPEGEIQSKNSDGASFGWTTLDASGVPVEVRTANFANTGGINEYIQWSWIVPPSCDPAGAFRCRVIWAPSNTDTGGMIVNIRHSFASDLEDMPASSFNNSLFSGETPSGTANRVQFSPWVTLGTMSGLATGDLLNLQIYRISADVSDTFTGTVQVIAVEFEYQEQASNDD